MARKRFLKAAAFLLLSAGLTVGAYAQVTISGGIAVSMMNAEASGGTSIDGDAGVGGNVYVDYLLPISIPLSLGGEIGIDSSSFSYGGGKDTVLAIPLLARVAYHFDLMPKLDLYLVGKIGMAFGVWSGDMKDVAERSGGDIKMPIGFAFGFDVGAAYYFTSTIGAFAEIGFDDYMLSTKVSGGTYDGVTIKAPFYRFFTAGLSVKF
jgi:hypothetical protein